MICIHQRACVRCHFLQLNLAALDFGNDVGEKVLSWGFALETACCSHCQQSFGPQELQERKREGERSNEPLHLLATVSLMGRLCPHCKRRQQPLAQRPENTEPPQVIHQDDLTHMPEDQFDPEVVFLFARPTPRSAIRPHPISALLREEGGRGRIMTDIVGCNWEDGVNSPSATHPKPSPNAISPRRSNAFISNQSTISTPLSPFLLRGPILATNASVHLCMMSSCAARARGEKAARRFFFLWAWTCNSIPPSQPAGHFEIPQSPSIRRYGCNWVL